MNYSTGKKIVISSLIANFILSFLPYLLLPTPDNFTTMSNIHSVINFLSVLVPAVLAFGFALMYYDGKNEYNIALAVAAACSFLPNIIYFIPADSFVYTTIYPVLSNCLCAVLPIVWAIKFRSKIPALSIALIACVFGTVFYPMILDLTVIRHI